MDKILRTVPLQTPVDELCVYLSGPIDFATNATGWRNVITNRLVAMGFSEDKIYNPCRKPLPSDHFLCQNSEGELLKQYRSLRKWAQRDDLVDLLAHIDLRMVDKSDIVFVNFPKFGQSAFQKEIADLSKLSMSDDVLAFCNSLIAKLCDTRVQTYGTMHEIVVARQQKKPVLVIWEGGISESSGWVSWLVGHENIFPTLDDAIDRLSLVLNGQKFVDNRQWTIFGK